MHNVLGVSSFYPGEKQQTSVSYGNSSGTNRSKLNLYDASFLSEDKGLPRLSLFRVVGSVWLSKFHAIWVLVVYVFCVSMLYQLLLKFIEIELAAFPIKIVKITKILSKRIKRSRKLWNQNIALQMKCKITKRTGSNWNEKLGIQL